MSTPPVGTSFRNLHCQRIFADSTVSIGNATDKLAQLSVHGSIDVDNLEVRGTLTTKHSEEVNIGDSNIRLNATNISNEGSEGGLLVHHKTIEDTKIVCSGYTPPSTTSHGEFTFDSLNTSNTNNVDNISIGDIVVVFESGTNDGGNMYKVHGKNGTAIQISSDTINVNFYHTPAAQSTNVEYDMYVIQLGHMKFGSNDVTYAFGHRDSDFNVYRYKTIISGRVSTGKVESNNTELKYPISKMRVDDDNLPHEVKLPTDAQDGESFKVINMHSDKDLTIKCQGSIQFASGDNSFTLHAGNWVTITAVEKFDDTVIQWYDML